MKVLFVYRFCGLGGVETATLNKIDALQSRGVNARALFSQVHGAGGKYLAGRPNVSVGLDLESTIKLIKEGFDVISVIDFPEFMDVVRLANVSTPIIFETHASSLWHLSKYFSAIDEPSVRTVFVPSEFNRRLVFELTRTTKDIIVMPNSLNLQLFHNIAETEPNINGVSVAGKKVVLWVGRLDDEKNPKELVQIGIRLLEADPSVQFVLVGDTWDSYEAQLDSLRRLMPPRTSSAFSFLRAVPQEEMPRLFSLAANSGGCLVSTSLNESFPMVLLEAMACKCPVVATQVGGVLELIRDGRNGRLYRLGDIEWGVEAVLGVIGEELGEERERIVGDALREIQRRHSYEAVGDRLVSALEAVVRGAGSGPGTVSSTPPAASYSGHPPTAWVAGQTRLAQITVKNAGIGVWWAVGPNPMRLGVHFGGESDLPHDDWATDQRFDLPHNVEPGGHVTLSIDVTAPAAPGHYVLRHRMVREGVAWSDQILKTTVDVRAADELGDTPGCGSGHPEAVDEGSVTRDNPSPNSPAGMPTRRGLPRRAHRGARGRASPTARRPSGPTFPSTEAMRAAQRRLRSFLGVRPLSRVWGVDRGLPIHRYFIEQFFREFAADIRGVCLEFQDPLYTPRFGGAAVDTLEILHVDGSNLQATIVADLTKSNAIPSDSFDCIVCTHVLHVIYDTATAVQELYRILKPGGVLLVAVPQVSMYGPEYSELWRFTPQGLGMLLTEVFGTENVTVRAYGNSLTAAGEIRGMVASEFTRAELDEHDVRFTVEVCARAVKLSPSSPMSSLPPARAEGRRPGGQHESAALSAQGGADDGWLGGRGAQPPLAILMYHAVVRSPLEVSDWCFLNESAFRNQVHYLKEHFDVVPLSEAVARLSSGVLRRPTAVITLDDGFANNYDVAFPILREARLPATVFLVTGLVDTDDTIWFCRVNRAVAAARAPWVEWDGCRFDLDGPRAKAETSHLIQERLKRFPQPELLEQLRQVVHALGDDPDRPIEPGSPFRILSREAIADMAASGLIEFGAHTRSHAILSCLPPEARREEIEASLAATAELTGRPCQLFAYPNGTADDYEPDSIRILEANGVRAAVTVIWGPNDRSTPPLELRRYGVGPDWSVPALGLAMHFGQAPGSSSP